jgi:integrase
MLGIDSPYSLADAFATYLETDSAQKTARSAKADAYFLGIALHFFNSVRKLESVNQVKLEDLQIFQIWLSKEQNIGNQIKEPWGDTTIEFYCRVLKKFFRKMHHLDHILKNPCEIWKVPRGTTEERRPMTLAEFDKLYAASEDWFRPVLMFIRLTGARGASLASLTWADVHFETKTLILRSRKGGLKQTKLIPIPMYPALFEFLHEELLEVQDDERPPRSSDPVFWGPRGIPVTAQEISSEGSRLIRKVVGLSGVVLYGLRHAMVTELLEAGASLEVAARAAGHSSVTQTSQYAKRMSLKVVSDAMEGIRGKKEEP